MDRPDLAPPLCVGGEVTRTLFSWQAASAGYAQSMHEIGTMHYLGDGVEPDSDEAVRWFRRAAELGVSGSMYLLRECLLAGEARTRSTRDET